MNRKGAILGMDELLIGGEGYKDKEIDGPVWGCSSERKCTAPEYPTQF